MTDAQIEAIRERRSVQDIAKDWPAQPYSALTRGGTNARDDILDLLAHLAEKDRRIAELESQLTLCRSLKKRVLSENEELEQTARARDPWSC